MAHRGGKDNESLEENTLNTLLQDRNLKLGGIEFDLHKSKDDQLVIIHDSIIRLGNRSKDVKDMTLKNLRYLRSKTPTFQEFLDALKTKKIHKHFKINIEVKAFGIVDILAKKLKQFFKDNPIFPKRHFMVTSYLHSEMLRFQFIDLSIEVGLIYRCTPLHLNENVQSTNAKHVVLSHYCISNENLERWKQQLTGVTFWIYTVNSKSKAKYFLRIGADKIITDFPNKFLL